MTAATCPECGAPEGDLDGLNVLWTTTAEDAAQGLVRVVLRCQACGFATSFVAQPVRLDGERQ